MKPENAAQPEMPFDEEGFFVTHLGRLEGKAAGGDYTEQPLFFIASIEQELQIMDPASSAFTVNYAHNQNVIDATEKAKILPAPDNFKFLDYSEEIKQLREFHENAREYIGALQPSTAEQRAKKERWLEMIPGLTIPDMINFKVYCEFSSPTLGETAPKKDASYQELSAGDQNDSNNWLEFRFGNEQHQKGWYDNQEITEFRLVPCSPTEAVRRHKIIEARMREVAAQHGCLTTQGGRHIHMSAFKKVAGRELVLQHSLDGTIQKARMLAPVFRSILGTAPGRENTNLRFVASLAAAIKDGAWMHDSTSDNVSLFKEVGKKSEIAETRKSVRLLYSRSELRERSLMASPAHGLLWLAAVVIDSQQRSLEQFKQDGYTVPQLRAVMRVERTKAFDKDRHLSMQRAIENSTYIEGAGFQLAPYFNLGHSHQGLGWLIGIEDPKGISPKQIKTSASAVNKLVMQSLRIDANGQPFCTPELLNESYQSLPEPAREDIKIDMSDPAVISQLNERINDNASGIRVVTGLGIKEVVQMQPLMPTERYAALLGSRTMQLAFGISHKEYARMLMGRAISALGKTSLAEYVDRQLTEAGIDL